VIPKVYDGKNKMFWFFTYNAFKYVKVEDPSTFNRTVPTLKARDGDFSDMLNITNQNGKYVVYDPATVVADPNRATHFVRTPFAGNIIPKSRFVNPTYNAIMKLHPAPNVSIAPNADPVNNYLANQTPYNWDYKAYSNRVDYQISDKFRMYGRWSFNNFGPEDRGDWTYESARGLNIGGLVRNNKGGNVDLVYTQSGSTIWDFNVAMNQFREGNIYTTATGYKPSDIGLPAYMDAKAGDEHILPYMNLTAAYTQISPGGTSKWIRYRSTTAKAEVSHVRGNHTLRAAFDTRGSFRTGGGAGNTSGNFTFNNNWVRRDDDGNAPNANLGLTWAAFILGLPANNYSIATLDSYAVFTPYYAGFFQDNWRVNPKLTLNFGLRTEWEGGPTERYNRMLAGFDPTLSLPITAGAQAAYAAAPIPELSAANFKVIGGSVYAGSNGAPRTLFDNQLMWMPRLGAAYQLNSKTVIRVGYGIFYDTLNALNNLIRDAAGPDQTNFSRSTNTNLSNDFGLNWLVANNPANNKSPLVDPFPVRSDGTRFDTPTRDALGSMAKAGRGNWNYADPNQERARQQRWRVGVQRQLGNSWVIDAAYAGAYSDNIGIAKRLDYLPEQYWANGTVRNDAIASNLNANVTNPFYIGNFEALKTSAPLVYADMATNGFFTSKTIQKNKLLRAYSQMNSVTDNTYPSSWTRSHEFQLNVEKRFSKGFNMNVGYTTMQLHEADHYFYEWDQTPTERISNDGRPHRIVGSAIWEVPVGKGKRFFSGANKTMDLIAGGWQFGATYEYQPGGLLGDWNANVFYYGSDMNDLLNVNRTYDTWFNTANFERTSGKGPAAYGRRTFPTRVPGLRADSTNQWNANAVKNLHITERWNLQLRMDALNVQNRSQMNGPSIDPYSTNFGKVTSQTAATNRWLQVQARLTF